MAYKLPDERIVQPGTAFLSNNIQRPDNWLRSATAAELRDNGITFVTDPIQPERKDDRFYYNNGNTGPVAKPIEQVTPALVTAIKAAASNLILNKYPQYKQANMTARGVELVFKLASGGKLDASEQDEVVALQTAFNEIKAIRSHSDLLESEVASSTFKQLEVWQQHDWPE